MDIYDQLDVYTQEKITDYLRNDHKLKTRTIGLWPELLFYSFYVSYRNEIYYNKLDVNTQEKIKGFYVFKCRRYQMRVNPKIAFD
jgi:hypothetical protein